VTAPKRRKPMSGPSRPAGPPTRRRTPEELRTAARRRAVLGAAAVVVVVGLIVTAAVLAGNGDQTTPAAAASGTPSAAAGATPAPSGDAPPTPVIPSGQPSFAVPTASGQLSSDPACAQYLSATNTFGSAMSASDASQQSLTVAMAAFVPSMQAAESSAKDPTIKSALTVEAAYFQAHGSDVITAVLAQDQNFLSSMPFLNADDYLETVCTPASS
jgi:hypothetical protein